jgi:hypothetical protein
VHTEPDRVHLVALILGSYAEMPGLSLHLHQAARLFGLRDRTCEVVLNDPAGATRLALVSVGSRRSAFTTWPVIVVMTGRLLREYRGRAEKNSRRAQWQVLQDVITHTGSHALNQCPLSHRPLVAQPR